MNSCEIVELINLVNCMYTLPRFVLLVLLLSEKVVIRGTEHNRAGFDFVNYFLKLNYLVCNLCVFPWM